MTIKGSNGEDYNVSSAGVGGAGLGLGIAGTALGLLNGGVGMFGGRGFGGYANGYAADGSFVTKYELSQEQTIASLNSENALLKADKYTDEKLVDVYNNLFNKIEALAVEVRLNKEQQAAVNAQQQVYNGVNNAATATLQSQVRQLLSITKVVIPNGAICPGWGDVTVNVESASTASTSSTSN